MGHTKAQIEEGNKRLLYLAGKLSRLPPERFYYGDYVGMDWKGAKDLSCGTTACAIGWAGSMPKFQALGLTLDYKRAVFQDIFSKEMVLDGTRAIRDSQTGRTGFAAGQRVFAISRAEAAGLFLPDEYSDLLETTAPFASADAKEVANWIRSFVKARRKAVKAGTYHPE
jgi:hypothetical protein